MSFLEEFNRLSFWLGFLAACILWFLAIRLHNYWKPIKDYFSQQINSVKVKHATTVEDVIRQEVLKRAQKAHLMQAFFSLDEVLIPPALQAPPKLVDPNDPGLIESAQPQILPNLPLVPQFSSQYNCETISIPRLLRSGVNIAIAGHPGTGKSVAIAYLAALFARKDSSLGPLSDYYPIYLHYNDLIPYFAENLKPQQILIKALLWHTGATYRSQVQTLVAKKIQEQKAFLLLDGLDEISYSQYRQALAFLKSLLKSCPHLRVVTTAALDRAYGLLALGIEPLPIAGWSRADISGFINRFAQLWNSKMLSNNGKSGPSSEIDGLLIQGWHLTSSNFFTPLEWVMRLWAIFTGEACGPLGADAVRSYVNRLQGYGIDLKQLSTLAASMLESSQCQITFIDAEKHFSEAVQIVPAPVGELSFEPGNLTRNETTFQAPIETDKKISQKSIGEFSIDTLVEYGLFREDSEERFSFVNPVLVGYLASLENQEAEPDLVRDHREPWSAFSEFLHYKLLVTKSDWVKQVLVKDTEPFYLATIRAALWMRDLPPRDHDRTIIMRYILQHAQAEETTYKTRLSLVAAAAMANDPASLNLARQLAAAPLSTLRQTAILCSGALQDDKAIKNIIGSLTDPELHVRWSGCFALVAMESLDAQNAVNTILSQSDEPLRLATAEALAARPPWGHEILKKAVTSSDLLTRRAVIFGLLHLRETWVMEILERLSIEDGQWVVRNFASQGLEFIQKDKRNYRYLPNASTDTPWLINYAAKQGHGIPKGESLVPILIQILNTGSNEEKVASIQLLGRYSDKAALEGVRSALKSTVPAIKLAAQDALWFSTMAHYKVD